VRSRRTRSRPTIGLASQGALQQSSDGRYLLAVDAGSNQISVVRIKPDGSLEPVGAGPVDSNGANPVSIAVHGNLVYVANAGTSTSTGETNYTGFTLNPGGHLRPLAGSTVTLPDNSQPGDVLFNSDGTKLVGARVNTSLIDSFTVGPDGLLTSATGSPFAAQGLGPFGSEFRPTNPNQLFVSNAHNGAGAGTVSAFNDASDGTLTSIGTSPFADNQTAPCWVEISHDGNYLFTVNTASKTISSYSVGPGRLAGAAAEHAAVDRADDEPRRRPPRSGRLHALDRRPGRRRDQRLHRRRRNADRDRDLPDGRACGRRSHGDRRHLRAAINAGGAGDSAPPFPTELHASPVRGLVQA
jgi:hypothetical protein